MLKPPLLLCCSYFGLLLEALKLWPTMTHSPQVLEESALTSQPYSVSEREIHEVTHADPPAQFAAPAQPGAVQPQFDMTGTMDKWQKEQAKLKVDEAAKKKSR